VEEKMEEEREKNGGGRKLIQISKCEIYTNVYI